MSFSAKEVALTYYNKKSEFLKGTRKIAVYVCRCGIERNQEISKGYTNLFSHVQTAHPDYMDVMNSKKKKDKESNPLLKFVNVKSSLVYNWLELVIELNFPFTLIESNLFRKAVKYEDISVDTFQKYLYLLTEQVEKLVAKDLPAKIGIVIDGWSEGSQHFFGVFAAFDTPEFPLLAIAPPVDEESYSSLNQAAFIVDCLEMYGKTVEDVLFLVADNTAVNPATARELHCPFIGCASHRFNLAVKEFMQPHEESLQNINDLMLKLSTLKIAGALRKRTDLKPIKRNVTRWSSTYSMLNRFFALKDILPALNNPEVNVFIPDGRKMNELEGLLKDFKKFESVTKALQSTSINLAEVRILFDSVKSLFPTLENRLREDASLVFDEHFQTGIVKIINGQEKDLSDEQVAEVAVFLKVLDTDVQEIDPVEQEEDFARALLKANERSQINNSSEYVNLKWIPPTSNICERLFSASRQVISYLRQVLTDYRKSMSPYTFECIMFLKMNRKYWDVDLVNEVKCI